MSSTRAQKKTGEKATYYLLSALPNDSVRAKEKRKPEVHILILDLRSVPSPLLKQRASVSVGLYVRTCIETVGCIDLNSVSIDRCM